MNGGSLKLQQSTLKKVFLIVAIILISFCMRAPLTSIGPLTNLIHLDLNISNGSIGLIMTLSLLGFAIASPFIAKIGRKFGIGTTIAAALVLIFLGSLCRSYGDIPGLFAGAIILSLGIAACNVLLPSIVVLKFPEKIGPMTTVYVVGMGVLGSIGAGLSYPLANPAGFNWGWQATLFSWSCVAFLSFILWFPYIKETDQTTKINSREIKTDSPEEKINVWKSPLAWMLTIFMGCMSFNFYSLTAWIPSLLHSYNIDPATAGYIAFVFQIIGLPASFVTPLFMSKMKNKSITGIIGGSLYFTGSMIVLFWHTPLASLIGLSICGLGGGTCFAWALAMIAFKGETSLKTSQLSGMTQSCGYLFAAIGPALTGLIFDITFSWNSLLYAVIITGIILMTFSYLSSKKERL